MADEKMTLAAALRRLANEVEADKFFISSSRGSVGARKFDLVKSPEAIFTEWTEGGANALYLVLSFRRVPSEKAED